MCVRHPPPAFMAPPFFCGTSLCHLGLAHTVSGDPAARGGGFVLGALPCPPLNEER